MQCTTIKSFDFVQHGTIKSLNFVQRRTIKYCVLVGF